MRRAEGRPASPTLTNSHQLREERVECHRVTAGEKPRANLSRIVRSDIRTAR